MTESTAPKATPSQMKDFFSVPEKPLTNAELIEFKKSDQPGYDELAFALGAHLAS